MRVKTFDEERLKKLLVECDPYLLKYIEALKRNGDRWRDISQKAMKKLRGDADEERSKK